MATARKIELSTSDSGVLSAGAREESARAASKILQDNLEKNHIYFNDSGFHNHIVHHILTMFALGASPNELKAAYERDKSYQKPVLPTNESVIQSLYDQAQFKDSLGNREDYPNFLEFFQREIEKKGVEDTVNQYVFAEDDIAQDMLARLFGGLIHPLIHLGFGIEFNQPAIIAEALAQTATHENWTGPMFLFPAEKAAGGIGKPGKKTLQHILEEIRNDRKLANSAHWEDGNRMRDGVLARAPDEMIKYAAEFTVSKDQLEEKLVEIIDTVDIRSKIRLLEGMGRLNLLLYVSRNTPELHLNEVTEYQSSRSWEDVFAYANAHPRDDGHIGKLARAMANGERICRPYETKAKERGLMITGDMWLKIGNMVMDSTSDEHSVWVRSTGFDGAWEEFDDRSHL
ncbi:hypothetical protein ETB97_004046 [Aspergillus alliaceus]|uniref:HypA-like protein n=1 Tax=Petromyces alliaceus TaxID=209559 RepID=A0A8H6AGR5_PETAA|nr:hypothetical protein ETB97_004046 [Aspergillus burnettii]